MKYSINPIKWLVWICRRIKYRNTRWIGFYAPLPLKRYIILDELVESIKLKHPELYNEFNKKQKEAQESTNQRYEQALAIYNEIVEKYSSKAGRIRQFWWGLKWKIRDWTKK